MNSVLLPNVYVVVTTLALILIPCCVVCPYHTEHQYFSRAATSVDFSSGLATEITLKLDKRLAAHAWLTFLGWGVGIPASVHVARRMKLALGYPGWLNWHFGINVLATLVSISGVASAVVHSQERGYAG